MKILKLISAFFILFAYLTGCSKDEEPVEVLFSYNDPYASSNTILLLSGADGHYLDSAKVGPSGTAKLSGPINLTEFVITKIVDRGSNLSITSFFNLTLSHWNDYVDFTGPTDYAIMNPDSDDQGMFLFNGNVSSTDENFSKIIQVDVNNQVFVIYKNGADVPKYKMYADFSVDNYTREMNSSDFTEMSIHKLPIAPEGTYLSSFYGRTSSASKAPYFLTASGDKKIQDFENLNSLYYPENIFTYFQTTFGFESSSQEHSSSAYYGELPSEISALDKGEFNLTKTIENYSAYSSNSEIDFIRSFFSDENGNSLGLYGANGKSQPIGEILATVGDLYPEQNIVLDQWSRTVVGALEGLEYNGYIEDLMNPDIAKPKTYTSYKSITFF